MGCQSPLPGLSVKTGRYKGKIDERRGHEGTLMQQSFLHDCHSVTILHCSLELIHQRKEMDIQDFFAIGSGEVLWIYQ